MGKMKEMHILIEDEFKPLSFGQLFKLRDCVGLCHAILGTKRDMTLAEVAFCANAELERRTGDEIHRPKSS